MVRRIGICCVLVTATWMWSVSAQPVPTRPNSPSSPATQPPGNPTVPQPPAAGPPAPNSPTAPQPGKPASNSAAAPAPNPPAATSPPTNPTPSPTPAIPLPPAGIPLASPPPPGGVGESPLGPIYVRDQNGTLVVFPLISLEQLDRLMQAGQAPRGIEPPRYSFLPGATISGSVVDAAAQLELKLKIQVHQNSATEPEWLRIPLHLNQAVWIPAAVHDGPGEFLIDFDPQADGYVLWLRTPPGTEHALTMQFKAPLASRNGVRQLLVRLPDTPLHLRLTVPGSGTEARVNGSGGNILNPPRVLSPEKTELVVDAAGGEVDLSWRELQELAPVLAAFGNISVSLDGRRLEYDAQLNVRSFGPPIDSFTVQLPPGTELISTNQFAQSGLVYSPLPDANNQPAARRLLVRRTEGKTSAPIEARLRCETTLDVVNTAAPLQVGGFEVLGARNQKGTLDFHVEGDWTIDWMPDSNVRRVDDLPDLLRQQKLAARFEYDRQPFSLRTSIREKKTRITVEPTWLISVESTRLTLDGALKYRISGARAKPLEIETNGWRIEQVAPENLIAGPWRMEGPKLVIPLASMVQGGGNEFELRITATRDHESSGVAAAAATRWLAGPGTSWLPGPQEALPPWGPATAALQRFRETRGDVQFPLPKPLVDAGLPALAIVSPADNVELTPVLNALRSLVNDSLPPEIKLPPRQQPPLVYREDVGGEPAQFSGQFQVRPRSVIVTADTRVRLEPREAAIEQRFQHAIAHEPLTVLRFDAPREIVDSGRFELLVDGLASAWTRPATSTTPAVGAGEANRAPLSVELRNPRIGNCEVVFRYRIPIAVPSGRNALDLSVPLVNSPLDPTWSIAAHRLRLVATGNLSASVADELWSSALDEGSPKSLGETAYRCPEWPASIRLAAQLETAPTARSTDISRVWIQTLMAAEERRDRACFRLTTNEQQLLFRLPPGALTEELVVAINGQRTTQFAVSPEGVARVELGEFVGTRELSVELWYWFPVFPVSVGRVYLEAPQLPNVVRAERIYWELILPANEHLAWNAAELNSENGWQRRSLIWSRAPRRSQGELEDWAVASRQPDLAQTNPLSFNRYVFSSVGSLGPKTVYTITRPMAVLFVAGFVLVVGTLLIYWSALRQPLALLVCGAAIIGGAVAFPEPAVAAGQLAAFGASLAVLAGLLSSLLVRPRPHRVFARPQPSADSRHSKPASSRVVSLNTHLTTASLQGSASVSASGFES